MPSDNTMDYEVGYGKPPRDTQFKKGHSGNPRGRPSGSKNLATLVTEALNEPVIIAENGERRKISKRQAIITTARQPISQGRLACDQDPARHPSGDRRPSRTGSCGEFV